MNFARSEGWRLQGLGTHPGIPALAVTGLAVAVAVALWLGVPVLYLPLGLAAALLTVLTLRSPALGLSFVIAVLYLPMSVGQFSSLEIVGVGVAVLCLFWFGIHKQGLTFPNVVVPMLIMILLMLYSLNITHNTEFTLGGLRRLLFNAIFCLLLVNIVSEYRWLRLPLWSLVLMGLLNSMVGLYQFGASSEIEFRSRGLMENVNELGMVAAMAFVIPFYFFLREKHRGRQAAYLALCAILAAGIVSSISRGATIAFLSSVSFILVRERRRWKVFAILGALVLAVLPFLPESYFHRFNNIRHEIEGTVFVGQRIGLSSRGYYNKAAIRIWKAHPLLGVGIGNFGYYFVQPEFNPGMKGSYRLPPHNIYLGALAEMGLVGFLVLCWWIYQTIHNYWRAERNTDPDSRDGLYLRVCEALTIMVLVIGLSGESLISTTLAMVITLSAVCRICSENASAKRVAAEP